MNVSKKLTVLCGLSVVFAIVLVLIYVLVAERMDYASAALEVQSWSTDHEVNDYRMIARSIKYGMLLVAFTFAVFFLYEVLQDLRIHPMQYLLVGAALSVFFLLLLSFAEQIGFVPAYVIAAVACIGLIVWYLQFVLGQGRAVLLMGALLVVAYAVMFVLLCLPTYNLLLGSVLLFVVLFAVMFLTRHIDWYALGESNRGVRDESEQY